MTPQIFAFYLFAVSCIAGGLFTVLSRNPVHSVLWLILSFLSAAGLFVLLGAEFVAWTVILVYIGAVIVLFLFGIMITRAPIGRDSVRLDHTRRWPAALISLSVFIVVAWSTTLAFGGDSIPEGVIRTDVLGDLLFSRYVIPFEAVSFVLSGCWANASRMARIRICRSSLVRS